MSFLTHCFLLRNQEAPETRDSHHRSQDTETDPIRMQYLHNLIPHQVGIEAWMKGEMNQMFQQKFSEVTVPVLLSHRILVGPVVVFFSLASEMYIMLQLWRSNQSTSSWKSRVVISRLRTWGIFPVLVYTSRLCLPIFQESQVVLALCLHCLEAAKTS